MRGDGVEHLAGGVAAGHALGVSREGGQTGVPARRQVAPLHALDLIREIGIFFSVGFKQRDPRFAQALPAPADAVAKMRAHPFGHQKLGVFGPSVAALGETDFFLTSGSPWASLVSCLCGAP